MAVASFSQSINALSDFPLDEDVAGLDLEPRYFSPFPREALKESSCTPSFHDFEHSSKFILDDNPGGAYYDRRGLAQEIVSHRGVITRDPPSRSSKWKLTGPDPFCYPGARYTEILRTGEHKWLASHVFDLLLTSTVFFRFLFQFYDFMVDDHEDLMNMFVRWLMATAQGDTTLPSRLPLPAEVSSNHDRRDGEGLQSQSTSVGA
ncbi:hypothetical protein AJ80_06993 [Polytolypa hystricis UAMH7299]|uniref:Uncharacterized protein n=1 Tax=Polytolypa hystricis (strain UAMH7299) TaxID=1447883 RepID=A0A2B7XSW7_POLH7|nr:hypothetical protein AJ80_06993 [Polytolypa hystricis UAMH7299]